MTTTKNFTIDGMTCSCCAGSVEKAVTAVSGVSAVSVSLPDSRVTVTGENFADADVITAVTTAGYTVNL